MHRKHCMTAVLVFLAATSCASARKPEKPPMDPAARQQQMTEQLSDKDAAKRRDALRHLCRNHDPNHPPLDTFVKALDDESLEVRKAVYESVARVKGLARLAAEHLIKMAQDKKRAEEAKYGLDQFCRAKTSAADAAEPLLKAMETTEGEPLVWISTAAVKVGAKVPDELALRLYRNDKELMDGWVVHWGEYCKSMNPEVIELLRQQLRDGGDGWHLAQAANGLGQIGPAAAAGIPELMDAMDSEVPHLRRYAARAIAMIGAAGEPALEKIRSLAKNDPDGRVKQWCTDAAAALEKAIAEKK